MSILTEEIVDEYSGSRFCFFSVGNELMLRYRVGFDLKRIPLARCRSVEYSVPSHQWKMIRLLPRFLPPRRFIDIFCLLMNIPRQNHMKTKEISLTSRIHHQSVIFSLFEQAGRWAFEYAHQLWIFLFYLLFYIPFTFHLVTFCLGHLDRLQSCFDDLTPGTFSSQRQRSSFLLCLFFQLSQNYFSSSLRNLALLNVVIFNGLINLTRSSNVHCFSETLNQNQHIHFNVKN